MSLFPTNPLSFILLVAGTDPIHETLQTSWWKKINIIGFPIAIIQFAMTISGYIKENKRAGAIEHFSNNIMRITILNKQLFTIVIPFVYILTKFFHIRFLEQFYSKLAAFDQLLCVKSRKHQINFERDVKEISKISFRLSVLGVFSLVVLEVIMVYVGILYIQSTSEKSPEFKIFYFYQLTVVNFLGNAFDITIKLNGLQMRLGLLVELQSNILKDIVRSEMEKKKVEVVFKSDKFN